MLDVDYLQQFYCGGSESAQPFSLVLTGDPWADPVPGADSNRISCQRMANEEKPVLLEVILEMWL